MRRALTRDDKIKFSLVKETKIIKILDQEWKTDCFSFLVLRCSSPQPHHCSFLSLSDGLTDCMDPDCCIQSPCQNSPLCRGSRDPLLVIQQSPMSQPRVRSFYDRVKMLVARDSTHIIPGENPFNSRQGSTHVQTRATNVTLSTSLRTRQTPTSSSSMLVDQKAQRLLKHTLFERMMRMMLCSLI